MKTALVLGGTMFFGKKLVERLLEEGVAVTIATRGQASDDFGDRVERLIVDREDKNTLEEALSKRSFDIVYDQSCFSPQEALDICDTLNGKISKLVFTSSGAVYDFGVNKIEGDFDPYTYSTSELKGRREYKGIFGYQEAKRVAEAVYFQKASFPVVAVRLPIVVGEADYTERLKFHVEKVVKEEPLHIPNLDNILDFITSDEAANFLFELGLSSFEGPINGSAPDDVSFRDLMKQIEDIVGTKAVYTDEQNENTMSPYALPASYSLCSKKAEQLGFTFRSVNDYIPELVQFYFKKVNGTRDETQENK
ncbi:NAD-dependent epimerase/dehydratase family protein [Alkalihalobacterium chitinilyticum]|uniref:NAD-dependent epimerase/dehydratase family protein n=1 Tax=Alkalihalobacterium chitinilyticum TaxID=2980103 RepID=A0ABT5VBV1_9BACI|nr:NAD-dependent epimerase/dehydratase family protein [Alkalihalobacterium chitinilyticum]MDE5412755.1 NAD-dependent epimerase/dehydratase family protein [Alkalihalobacterium chitinilyticum]